MKRHFLSLMTCVALVSVNTGAQAADTLENIVTAEHRSQENIDRNVYRHPVETLKFFDIQPDQTVVEINPGGGWYTEILGPYLKDEGELYLAIFADDSARSYAFKSNENIKKMTSDKNLYGNVNFTVLDTPDTIGPFAPEGSADRILTFRNVHNWMSDGSAEATFKSFYTALKPGGILGVVEHRAKADTPQDPKAESGYVREDYVIDLAKQAGFELVETSEINANPKDTTDHPEGVWTLLPRLRLGDQDREKYLEIGESDRMTLKFIKPAE